MKYFIIYSQLLFCVLGLCSFKLPYKNQNLNGKIANTTVAPICKELCKKYNVRLGGYGGTVCSQVSVYVLSLHGRRSPITLVEARAVITDIYAQFLKTVNSNKAIRPYLSEYPFTSKNLEVLLSFDDEQGKPFPRGFISDIIAGRGKICYYEHSSVAENRHKPMRRETYEEATKLLEADKKQSSAG